MNRVLHQTSIYQTSQKLLVILRRVHVRDKVILWNFGTRDHIERGQLTKGDGLVSCNSNHKVWDSNVGQPKNILVVPSQALTQSTQLGMQISSAYFEGIKHGKGKGSAPSSANYMNNWRCYKFWVTFMPVILNRWCVYPCGYTSYCQRVCREGRTFENILKKNR